MIFLS